MQSILRWLRFNLWYFGNPPWDTQVTPPERAEYVRTHPPGVALDLGCGSGTNLAHLARHGWQVHGIDFALKAVETARRRLAREQLQGSVQAGDVTRLETLQGPFDLVLDIGCYHSIDPSGRERYRGSLNRLLKDGGSFLIYAHLKDQPDNLVGLDEQEIARFASQLRLVWRMDSQDRRGRNAVWINFEK